MINDVPAAGMKAPLDADILHVVEGFPLLIAEYGLVLRAVILERPVNVLHAGDHPNITHENDDAHQPLKGGLNEPVVRQEGHGDLEPAVDLGGQVHKKEKAQRERERPAMA
jgi:hypothetical protein